MPYVRLATIRLASVEEGTCRRYTARPLEERIAELSDHKTTKAVNQSVSAFTTSRVETGLFFQV